VADRDTLITLRVNGVEHKLQVEGDRSLLSVLRTELGLTGTKYGCGQGQCGACTVLLNDEAVRSCVLPVSAADGQAVTTIEGLELNGKLHPVQEAFLETQAFQCGYCTPGLVIGAVALLRRNPHPTESDIREALSDHLCRCGMYARVVSAVQLASRKAAE
jgi:aerobic-type carbon monoxide dehydrogenase small subunit (CoxS/CutS family)